MENQRIAHGKFVGQLVGLQNMGATKNTPEEDYVGTASFHTPTGRGVGLTGLSDTDYNGLLEFVGKNVVVTFSGEAINLDPFVIQVDEGIEVKAA